MSSMQGTGKWLQQRAGPEKGTNSGWGGGGGWRGREAMTLAAEMEKGHFTSPAGSQGKLVIKPRSNSLCAEDSRENAEHAPDLKQAPGRGFEEPGISCRIPQHAEPRPASLACCQSSPESTILGSTLLPGQARHQQLQGHGLLTSMFILRNCRRLQSFQSSATTSIFFGFCTPNNTWCSTIIPMFRWGNHSFVRSSTQQVHFQDLLGSRPCAGTECSTEGIMTCPKPHREWQCWDWNPVL